MWRRTLRAATVLAVLGVGVYANGLRLIGQPWPRWMDGRYGGPVSWTMFSESVDCGVEVVGIVSQDGVTVEVGRPPSYPGPGEWFWGVADAWHAFSRPSIATMDMEAVNAYARRAAGLPRGEVVFVVRERLISEEGVVQVRDIPLVDWMEAC
jgi:hypothetical protein